MSMIEKLFDAKNGENTVKEFSDLIRAGVPCAVFGVPDAFKSFLVACLDAPVLYVARDGVTATAALAEIKEYGVKSAVYLPPKDETLLIGKAFSKETLYKRLAALADIESARVIITTAETLIERIPLSVKKISVKSGDEINRDELISKLVALGYERRESAEAKGTFAARGDVLDVFSPSEEYPYRLDFFGDEVENVKRFDPDTRKNLGLVSAADILQAAEYTFDGEDVKSLIAAINEDVGSSSKRARGRIKEVAAEVKEGLSSGDSDSLCAVCALLKNSGSIFRAIAKDTVVIFDEARRGYDYLELKEREFTERAASLKADGEVFSFSENNSFTIDFVREEIKPFRLAALQTLSTAVPYFNPLKILNPAVSKVADYRLSPKEIYPDIKNWAYGGYRVLVAAGDMRRAERFCGDLSAEGVASSLCGKTFGGVCVTDEKLTRGFIFHENKTVVIGTGNLFGKSPEAIKARPKRQTFFTAPEAGDYCVHETHGIGKVLGTRRISTSEGTKDYISVEYAGGDVLHVPVEQLDILTRYLGGEKNPKLSKIGGKDFEKIKAAAKESIKKMSFDLKKLYGERNALKGFKFSADTELEEAFGNAFEFEETPDQTAADEDIKADMTSGRVMDRLVCGDVGFGKTEVAMRAAFRAVVNGKQVAMLAPTTILSEQHYNTAIKRFNGFGVKIACLNRFRSATEQKKIIEKVKLGEIDFVIGTHRLLSKDVGFYDLGLLILDEEQRFGVEHKEKIKLLKKNVDVLTLSATPIPRTLHMSLTGIREISTINTPPKKRLPVQTYVTEETDALIKDALVREANRGGQSFILYNRVETIYKFAERIKSLVPNIKCVVAHGRMDEKELERSVLKFYRGECDALISTTIIENGVDLPKANTLIVIEADKLGLSTLYQLKGRVGRSDRLAYAYFTFRREKVLSEAAYERMSAITDFTEMGSGIKIAMRDLEIRGAGNVLGAEQHGHMDKIGYELYSKLLREELSGKEEIVPELDVRVSAYIPESYIEGNVARMDAYKQIAEINDEKSEREFIEYAEDAYGKLPAPTVALINIAAVKSLAAKIGVTEIKVCKEEVSITLSSFKAFADEKLAAATESAEFGATLSMERSPKIKFEPSAAGNLSSLFALRRFLKAAAPEESDRSER